MKVLRASPTDIYATSVPNQSQRQGQPENRQGAFIRSTAHTASILYRKNFKKNRMTGHKREAIIGDVKTHIAEHYSLYEDTINWDST